MSRRLSFSQRGRASQHLRMADLFPMSCSSLRSACILALMLLCLGSLLSTFAQQTEAAKAKTPSSWTADETLAAYARSADLMESTAILVPNLSRTTEPLLEASKQAVTNLNGNGQMRNMVFVYKLITNVRAYLQLFDALEKPYPLPETAARQITELRLLNTQLEALHMSLMEGGERTIRGSDWDNRARYRDANSKLPRPGARNPRVVFLGDSITDAWRLEEYFSGSDFVNRGISGQITGQMLGRFKQDVVDLAPQAVVILAGTNDIGRGVSSDATEQNLTMIMDLAEKHRIKVILCTLLPVSDYALERGARFQQTLRRPPSRILALNTWIRNAARTRNLTVVDYHQALADEGGFLKRNISDDGLHPNAAGYRIMAPLVQDAIRKAVRN